MTGLNVFTTGIAVSVLPRTHPDFDTFLVTVEWRAGFSYAVCHLGRVLNRDGEWEHEPQPSSRTDEFRARTRYPRWEALDRARDIVQTITVNGISALDLAAGGAS